MPASVDMGEEKGSPPSLMTFQCAGCGKDYDADESMMPLPRPRRSLSLSSQEGSPYESEFAPCGLCDECQASVSAHITNATAGNATTPDLTTTTTEAVEGDHIGLVYAGWTR